MSIHHLSLAFESASPFSKCFQWALSQLDTLNKPNEFGKHPIWRLKAPEDYYEKHGTICMSCVGKCCDWAGGLNLLWGLFTEQSVERGGLMLIVTLQIYVTQLKVLLNSAASGFLISVFFISNQSSSTRVLTWISQIGAVFKYDFLHLFPTSLRLQIQVNVLVLLLCD